MNYLKSLLNIVLVRSFEGVNNTIHIMLSKNVLLLNALLTLFLLSTTCVSCSGIIACKAVTSSHVSNKCILFDSCADMHSMVMGLERETDWVVNSTYFLGSIHSKGTSAGSIKVLGERKVFFNGRELGEVNIPFDTGCNLYMISCDSGDQLSFTKNHVIGIANRKDYLWSSKYIEKGGGIQVDFSHLAVSLEIVLEGLHEMKLVEPVIYLTPPDDSGLMLDLSTGDVATLKRKETFEQMKMNGERGNYLMVPIKDVQRMEVLVLAFEQRDGKRMSRYFSGYLNIPINGFEPGMKYLFTGVIEKGGVYLSSPKVSTRSVYSVVGRIVDKGRVD